MHRRSPRILWIVSLLGWNVGVAEEDLAARSPFLPPTGAPAAVAAPEPSTLELKGVMRDADGTVKYAIYNTAKKTSTWVKENEAGHGFVVQSHKGEGLQQQVTIEHQGRTLSLVMKTPKIASAGNVPMAGPVALAGPRPAAQIPAAAAVSSADQAAALQAVASQVEQRRLARQQSSGGPQPVPVPANNAAPRPTPAR